MKKLISMTDYVLDQTLTLKKMKTKKLILLIATILCAVSCYKKEYKNKFKYNSGDEVYIKLDKTKCIIQEQLNLDSIPSYNVLYLDDDKNFQTLNIYEYNLIDNNL